ncbi:MAG: divalent-cation tolerance protein CutA, partial [Spirochaetia bacterium]|nr:divalent-cation tolerance protein CutA [Spirochaetia bacterium]
MAVQLLYVTTKDKEEALRIGGALVEERLCACVNILPGMESIYHWNGAIARESECVLIVKVREDMVAAAQERILKLHSYTVPCVLALPVTSGNPAYLDWLA